MISFASINLITGISRNLGNVRAEKVDLVFILRFQQVHDIFEDARLHVHDILEAVDKAHFEVHRDIFVDVTAGVVALRAEHGAISKTRS